MVILNENIADDFEKKEKNTGIRKVSRGVTGRAIKYYCSR